LTAALGGVAPVAAVSGTGLAGAIGGLAGDVGAAPAPGFAGLVDQALTTVSAEQNDAAEKQAAYAAGRPGASLGAALVASDRAEVAWNATVAVRNEVVTAYQSIMNMQF
jgi:flagellar hook-basal body complex protein FliE